MNPPDQPDRQLEYDRIADMGHVLDHFPVQNRIVKRWLPLVFGVIMILSGIALTANLIFRMRSAIQLHGRAILLTILPSPTACYALILIGGIIIVTLVRVHWSDNITLFQMGFVKDQGNRVKFWQYQAIQRFDSHVKQVIFGGSIVSTQVKVILEDNHKRLLLRNNYIGMDDLIHLLRLNILPGLIERANHRLAEGGKIEFHKRLQATQHGLIINGNLTQLDQIETVIQNQLIKLHQKGQPELLLFKSKLSNIKNLDVLLDLLSIPPNPNY
ncbi:MAG: hypothetical protein K0B06_03805 [Brevefilum sp.]|nr:hypothetical protein [Brevefilum sp.]